MRPQSCCRYEEVWVGRVMSKVDLSWPIREKPSYNTQMEERQITPKVYSSQMNKLAMSGSSLCAFDEGFLNLTPRELEDTKENSSNSDHKNECFGNGHEPRWKALIYLG